ncbi:MAG: hypothetical protein IPP15_00230 [Saprospiraceae bacterium]|uniref:Uncharacterized protein n=1 Tax=Candidatus Opimibacter skivensis TaxID=2982028 RepID=A0A9D7XRL4_9BACT|nr:hypothetical protein [Candidatus Opimibacter skivensis]
MTRKTPLQAEYRPSGYLLFTDQHISLLDKKGKLVHSKDYPQLTSTNLMGLAQFGADIAGVNIDIAGSMENMKQLDRLSKGAYRNSNAASEGTSKTQVLAGAYYGGTPLFEVTMTRYSNSRNARDHKFILTKDGESKRAIMMVNKDTGKVDKKINVVDLTPQYIVDEVDTRVFLCERNKTITCYDMK